MLADEKNNFLPIYNYTYWTLVRKEKHHYYHTSYGSWNCNILVSGSWGHTQSAGRAALGMTLCLEALLCQVDPSK